LSGATVREARSAIESRIAWEIGGQAHNDGLLLVAIMLFVAAAVEGRSLLATLALTAGFCAKVTLAPILALHLVFVARTKGPRAAAAHALSAFALRGR
jgi:hypothetical protein